MNSVHITTDRLDSVLQSIDQLVSKKVLAGIPAHTSKRQEDAPNNAALGYLHETGAPADNLPARPFLVPGVKSAQKAIAHQLGKGASAALDGAAKRVDKALHAAGLAAQNAVRARLTEGPFAPLADATLRARARRGRKGAAEALKRRAQGETPNNAQAKPLIDRYRPVAPSRDVCDSEAITMLDLSTVLLEADFADTSLICLRQTQTIDRHGLAKNTQRKIALTGVVTPDSGDVLARTANGARIGSTITIHTAFGLSVGNETHDADIVIWQGRRYTVTAVAGYSAYGFVCATAELIPLSG